MKLMKFVYLAVKGLVQLGMAAIAGSFLLWQHFLEGGLLLAPLFLLWVSEYNVSQHEKKVERLARSWGKFRERLVVQIRRHRRIAKVSWYISGFCYVGLWSYILATDTEDPLEFFMRDEGMYFLNMMGITFSVVVSGFFVYKGMVTLFDNQFFFDQQLKL